MVEGGGHATWLADANGRTLLHAAVGSGSAELARVLIDAGVLVRVGDANLRAPSHLANQMGNRAMVELLLEKGAVVDTRAIDDTAHPRLPLRRHRDGQAPDRARRRHRDGAWAVETRSTILVLGYSQVGEAPARPSLANGHVTADLLASGKSLVYVAHEFHPESSRFGLSGVLTQGASPDVLAGSGEGISRGSGTTRRQSRGPDHVGLRGGSGRGGGGTCEARWLWPC